MVIADNLGWLVSAVYAKGTHPTGPEVLLASWAFGIQVYCDFSGYSDIARGTARWFGFELMVNFRLPYFATNIGEFWTRWHISLSSWLRDYVYIPLGGNQRHRDRNLFLTLLLGGLWHGAASPTCSGARTTARRSSLHRHLRPWIQRVAPTGGAARAAWTLLCVVVNFQIVTLGWPLFRAPSIERSGQLFRALFTDPTPGLVLAWGPPFALLCAPLLRVPALAVVERRSRAGRALALRAARADIWRRRGGDRALRRGLR